jgi:pantoate--beta-alanine ligase
MQVIKSVAEIREIVKEKQKNGKMVGFVPTMGALHKGHLSLVSSSKKDNDITVVSIFVNPTQFNDKEDLKNYPRMLDNDIQLLAPLNVDFIFAPTEEEMYPEPDERDFDFGNLDKVMEGAHRPGHFRGVAQIVSKLFAAIPANRAYFGDKDFQQVAVIKAMVKQLDIPIKIIPCPIVREEDGLALSSRNLRLNSTQRANAPLIYSTLKMSREFAQNNTIEDTRKWVCSTIDANSELKTEYFEIVDENTLCPVKSWEEQGNKVGCIAVQVGEIRLIDNIRFNL